VHKPNIYYKRMRKAPLAVRVLVGTLLIVGGLFGFLPILGFWMIPLGLAVILSDVPAIRRIVTRSRRWLRKRIAQLTSIDPNHRRP